MNDCASGSATTFLLESRVLLLYMLFLDIFFLACLTESRSFGYKRFLNHTQFVTVKTDDIQGMWFHVYGWLLKVQGMDQG